MVGDSRCNDSLHLEFLHMVRCATKGQGPKSSRVEVVGAGARTCLPGISVLLAYTLDLVGCTWCALAPDGERAALFYPADRSTHASGVLPQGQCALFYPADRPTHASGVLPQGQCANTGLIKKLYSHHPPPSPSAAPRTRQQRRPLALACSEDIPLRCCLCRRLRSSPSSPPHDSYHSPSRGSPVHPRYWAGSEIGLAQASGLHVVRPLSLCADRVSVCAREPWIEPAVPRGR